VACITLNRPRVLNALDVRTHEELSAAFDEFERNDELWIAVLTGAGDRSFSVGQDLKELVERSRRGVAPSTFGSRGAPGFPRFTERFATVKPVIARVNGYAFGGGFELALACDIVVAAEHATFALTEARLGLIPGAGGVFRLTRQIPFKMAMGYLMTGRRITARRGFELGLVNEVVPAGDLDGCVDRWIEDLLRSAPLSVRAIKEAAHATAGSSLAQAFNSRHPCEEARMRSRDAREGPQAFVEKRAPVWLAR